jgi:cupin 2 domain-containing protein
VIVLAGSAAIRFENEPQARSLKRGDYLHIPAHAKHRVVWTDVHEPTIWLAVHHR